MTISEHLQNFYRRITQPSPNIQDAHRRQQIRLINAIVLFFVPLAILAGVTHVLLVPSDTPLLYDPAITMVVLASILLTVAAFLGRFVGYWGSIGLVFVTGYAIIIVNASFDNPDYFDATYIILLSVLAAALFNIKFIALIALIEVLSINLLLGHDSPVNSINLNIFLIVSNLIIMFTVSYRNLIEKDRLQKLTESETFLRRITSQLPVSVWITDMQLSRRATFGRTNQIDQLATIPSNKAIHAYREALDGKSVQFETQHQRQTFQYHIEPMRDSNNEIIGTLGVATDITEQKMAQQFQLERERVEILSKFIEHSSHDLRTPISNINTYLYLLDNSVKTDKEHEYVNIIREQSERLHSLISNMLMMQRLELDTHHDVQEVSLKSLLDALTIAYQDRMQSHQLQFDYELSSSEIIIHSIDQNIYIALSKLLDNAIQFTPNGGQIRIFTTHTADTVTISVQDTGVGIAEEQLPHIFEIFYRGDDSRSTTSGDNGLGLSIVERIVKVHKGTITVESTVGVGSTFHITLPTVSLQQLF